MKCTLPKIVLTIVVFMAMVGCDSQTSSEEQPDEIAPNVSIISPTNGTEVTKPVEIQAEVSDNRIVEKVIFIVDGIHVSTLTNGPYEYSWDPSDQAETLSELQGDYSIEVKAFDEIGNEGSDKIIVDVLSPPPPISLLSDGPRTDDFQVIFEIEGAIFIERIITSNNAGFINDSTLNSEYERFDRITLPSEEEKFPCTRTDWETDVHGETRDGFEVRFTRTFNHFRRRC